MKKENSAFELLTLDRFIEDLGRNWDDLLRLMGEQDSLESRLSLWLLRCCLLRSVGVDLRADVDSSGWVETLSKIDLSASF